MIDKPGVPMEVPRIRAILHKKIPFKPGKTLKERVIAESIAPVAP
jgi:hypothetical protein